jgi:cytochrome b subunit of formate dehydrogenase
MSENVTVAPAHPEVTADTVPAPPSAPGEEAHVAPPSHYKRFTRAQRIEHVLLFTSFTTLVVTGLPQLYSLTWIGSVTIWLFGGIEMVRIIHRAAAVVLMLETIYHGGIVTYKVFVKRVSLTMMPGWQDVIDAFQSLGHNLGLAKNPPRMGRYTFGEKAEYWAVIWGTVIMVLTGFMLWNPIATTRFLPGQAIPAAKAAHGGEALLAILSIITWHVYNVHIKYFNRSIFTGRISRHEMEEEHPLELAAIEAGETERPVDPVALRRRQRIFYPVAVVISVALLLGLYWFVTFEQTAIVTLPTP